MPTAAPASARERVLDAALELFAERTFAGTPVPLIAERAQVGAGTIYRYFPSKEELVNELYRHWKHVMAAEVSAELVPGLDARDELGRLWRGLGRFAVAHPTAYRFLEGHHHDAYLDDRSREVSDELRQVALAYLRRAQRAGAVRRGSPEVLLALVLGAFRGLVELAASHGRTINRRELTTGEDAAWSLLAA